jgi:hypothetical protein
MTTKTIRGNQYELDGYYTSLAVASNRAKNLDGRLHIFTGAITRTAVTKTKNHPPLYAVWVRKEPNKKRL